MYTVAKEIDKLDISFCCIQEVRHRNTGRKVISLPNGHKYAFLWCGNRKRRDAGVGFLIKVDPKIKFDEVEINNPRVIAINVNIYGFKLRVVNGYAPTNIDGTENQKTDFYRLLSKACKQTSKNHKLIISGDFNAETAVSQSMSFFHYASIIEDSSCNDNGERLKTFCRSQRLHMIQTNFDYPIEDRYTWYSNDHKTRKILDYTLTEHFIEQYIDNCSVKQENIFNSDHRLVLTELTTPMTKKARYKKKVRREKPINIKALRNLDIQNQFTTSTKGFFKPCHKNSLNDISKNLISSLNHVADEVIPRMTKLRTKEIWKDDQQFNLLLDQRSNTTNIEERISLTRRIKKRVRYLRNQQLKDEADDIDERSEKRDIEGLYRSFKNQTTAFKTIRTQSQCDPVKLREHFEKHFDSTDNIHIPIELEQTPTFIKNLIKSDKLNLITTPPTKKEIIDTLNSLKLYKSSNDVPLAYIKYAAECEAVIDEIVKLYQKVWQEEKVPLDWCHSKLVALWKGPEKGKITEPEAYRGIQIGSTMCKILVTLILSRISKWYNSQLADQQQGFRQGRGTTDGIFVVKRIQQICRASNKKVYALFVDLSAAFDHVNRDWMFKTITQRIPNKCNHKLIKILQEIYKHTTTSLEGDPLGIFETKSGVRQGGPESPALYNLYMDYVMRVFMEQCKIKNLKYFKTSYNIPGKATNPKNNFGLGSYGELLIDWLGYADDLVLFFDDIDSLKSGFELLNSTFKRYELEINYDKTKTMIFNYEGDQYPNQILELPESLKGKGKGIIKNVPVFRYLGCQIHYNQAKTGEEELNTRVDSATARFYALSTKFFNHKIALKTRVKIMNSLVRTRLTYGCATWTLTVQQKNRMNSEYASTLRKMVRGGFRRKKDSYSYVYTNEQLYTMCNTTPLTNFIDKQQRSYIAHLIRQDDTLTTKRLLFDNTKNRIPGRAITPLQSVAAKEQCSELEIIERAIERRI